jgi:hypothetical protein
MAGKKTNPESSSSAQPIEVAFTLKTPAGSDFLSPDQTEHLVLQVMNDSVPSEMRDHCTVKSVYPNLQTFTVEGPAAVVQGIGRHPDVASAITNELHEDILIRPVKKRVVSQESKAEPSQKSPKKRRPE